MRNGAWVHRDRGGRRRSRRRAVAGRARLRRRWCWSAPTRRRQAARDRDRRPPHRRRADRVHDARRVRGVVRRRRRVARGSSALTPAKVLARHAWADGSRLDLTGDVDANAQAIGDFAGAARGARAIALSRARSAGMLRDARRRPSSAPRARTRCRWRRASGCSTSRACGRSRRSRRCGARSARISAIPGCDSCLGATPPIAAPRRSSRRRR